MGYRETTPNGESVEVWASNNALAIVDSAKDKPSFVSGRWKRGCNPDLAFVSTKHLQNFEKTIGDQIPKSQPRPIVLKVKPVIQLLETKPMPRFNYRKAKWDKFTSDLDAKIAKNPPKDYKEFQKLVWQTAVQHIPRVGENSAVWCYPY